MKVTHFFIFIFGIFIFFGPQKKTHEILGTKQQKLQPVAAIY